MKTIPLALAPPQLLKALAPRFKGLARVFIPFFPGMDLDLKQAGIKFSAEEYSSYILTALVFNCVTFTLLFYLIFMLILQPPNTSLWLVSSLGLTLFTLLMQFMYPKYITQKRAKDIERTLLFALRNLQIRLKSGIPLYKAMKGVGAQDFGLVSKEFKRTVNEIEGGIPQIQAIERMAFRNPSPHFQRVAWQIANGLKAGASIEKSIDSITKNLAKEQLIRIKNYGAKLNPLAMMYMMISVVMPALGITFLLLLGSFFGMGIGEHVFYLIAFFLAVFQFMFMGIIKTNRPVIEL
jgi:pilus assembly protein TadC